LRDQDWGKDNKIFREVEALSRLSHRYIVRYHSTWIETSEPVSAAPSEDDDSEDGDETEIEDTADGRFRGALRRRKTLGVDSVKRGKSAEDSDPFAINFDSLTTKTTSSDNTRSDGRTFPTIHFSNSGSKPGEDSDGDFDSDEMDDIVVPQIRQHEPLSELPKEAVQQRPPVPKGPSRTLYIQMVVVQLLCVQ
jgi:translation initiation factor 2-alpha kinase 4